MFSRAWQGLHIFAPRVTISRAWYGFDILLRLALVNCFSRPCHWFHVFHHFDWLHFFVLCSDWSIQLFLFAVVGQWRWHRFGFPIAITKPLHVWRRISNTACRVYLQMLLSSDATTNKSRFSTKMDLNRAMLLVCSEADDIWTIQPKRKQPSVEVNSKKKMQHFDVRKF